MKLRAPHGSIKAEISAMVPGVPLTLPNAARMEVYRAIAADLGLRLSVRQTVHLDRSAPYVVRVRA